MATALDTVQDAEVLFALSRLEDRESVRLAQDVQRNGYLTVKTVVEYALALGLLIVAAPVIAVCAVLVRLTSRGPAFYSQTRLGLGGRPYRIYKLRTMYHQCELLS